jgi:hypothetical protein
MTRILEFQPTDEQTVIARVLVELHQAIDSNFPGISPSTKQFTKTVLTNQNELTKENATISNTSNRGLERPIAESTSRNNTNGKLQQTVHESFEFKTAGIKTLLGETRQSLFIKNILIISLILGMIALGWIVFIKPDNFFE